VTHGLQTASSSRKNREKPLTFPESRV